MFKQLCFFVFLCFVFIAITAERVKAEKSDIMVTIFGFESSFIPQDQWFIKQCKNQQDCEIKATFSFKKSPENSILHVFKSTVKKATGYSYGRVKWWNDLRLSKVKMTPKENNLILVEITGYGGRSDEKNQILKQNINFFEVAAEEFLSLITINLFQGGYSGFLIQEFEFNFDEGKIKSKVGVIEKLGNPPDIQIEKLI